MRGDRPAHEISAEDEIEITPEMVEAGVKELNIYDWRLDWPADEVREIFSVMMEKKIPKRKY